MGLSVAVKKAFGAFTLDVSWHIGSELAVLFGYSGAGKSLTLQMIAGLVRPNAGSIVLNERPLFDSSARIDLAPQQRSFGYVFQDLALFPHMTVEENILFGGHGIGQEERRERVNMMISRFRLSGLEKKRPSEISGGQKQRVAFARALIRHPDALLLDEPFSALDAPLRVEMRELLRDIRREFMIPVVLVTHDWQEAMSLADRLIVYGGGRVLQSGTAAEITQHPANNAVSDLVRPASELSQDSSWSGRGAVRQARPPRPALTWTEGRLSQRAVR
jgi:molybdate transport system ATP-binding protein